MAFGSLARSENTLVRFRLRGLRVAPDIRMVTLDARGF